MKSFLSKYFWLFLIIALATMLRVYNLGGDPPHLYWDEASLGYNAYSIYKTGFDEHHNFMPLTNFAAFGDYKPPLYIYATVPSIAVFGLNEFAVRFPSALFGVLTVLLVYFLTKKLFPSGPFIKIKSTQIDIPLAATFLLAISPWHLQFSRAAFEANLGLFFSTLGIYLFFKFAKDSPKWLLPSLLSFLAGMYTFTGQRLFAPFIVAILFIQFRKEILKNWKYLLVSAFVCVVVFYPLFIFSTRTIEGKLRFNEVTIFNDSQPVANSIRDRKVENFSFLANILHNRRFYQAQDFAKHYFDAFSPTFLVTSGDVNPRLSTQGVGELYYLEALAVPFGIYFLVKNKSKYRWFLLAWLLASPLGPATARETPHALRMIHILPTFQIIAAFGFLSLYQVVRFKKTLIAIFFVGLLLNFVYYLNFYYELYPQIYSGEWQYGYKQAVAEVKSLYPEADQIIISNALGRPYIYFLLFNTYSPQKFWETSQVVKDKFYFIQVNSFDKFKFVDNVESVPVHGKVVYVATSGVPKGTKLVDTIKDLAGHPVFYISKNYD